jgi:hypothetical protein
LNLSTCACPCDKSASNFRRKSKSRARSRLSAGSSHYPGYSDFSISRAPTEHTFGGKFGHSPTRDMSMPYTPHWRLCRALIPSLTKRAAGFRTPSMTLAGEAGDRFSSLRRGPLEFACRAGQKLQRVSSVATLRIFSHSGKTNRGSAFS